MFQQVAAGHSTFNAELQAYEAHTGRLLNRGIGPLNSVIGGVARLVFGLQVPPLGQGAISCAVESLRGRPIAFHFFRADSGMKISSLSRLMLQTLASERPVQMDVICKRCFKRANTRQYKHYETLLVYPLWQNYYNDHGFKRKLSSE